jgi:hypothetical protein
MLAEFKYGLVPKESFAFLGDQAKSGRYVGIFSTLWLVI